MLITANLAMLVAKSTFAPGLEKLAETVCGVDHEGIPFLPLQDQDGADIGVGQFQGPLQGDRKTGRRCRR